MERIRPYQPVIVVVATAMLMAAALHHDAGEGFMRFFMGTFFVLFALFKLFDLQGFATAFRKYDIPAQQWQPYAFLYPFIELGMGLAYLAGYLSQELLLATLTLMLVSGAGVLREIRRGNRFQCACLGTILNVPLSTVTIIENFGMAAMAAGMLRL